GSGGAGSARRGGGGSGGDGLAVAVGGAGGRWGGLDFDDGGGPLTGLGLDPLDGVAAEVGLDGAEGKLAGGLGGARLEDEVLELGGLDAPTRPGDGDDGPGGVLVHGARPAGLGLEARDSQAFGELDADLDGGLVLLGGDANREELAGVGDGLVGIDGDVGGGA